MNSTNDKLLNFMCGVKIYFNNIMIAYEASTRRIVENKLDDLKERFINSFYPKLKNEYPIEEVRESISLIPNFDFGKHINYIVEYNFYELEKKSEYEDL